MTPYRCIFILLAFFFCLSSAVPITGTLSIDNSPSIDGIDNTLSSTSISNELNSIPWSTTERGTSNLFQDFFQKYTTLSLPRSKNSNLRRRIARPYRRHP